ncbi:hypothetical protein [Thermincola ferriacetica]
MERLKKDLGIRALLALILVTAFIGMIYVLLILFGKTTISKDVMAVVAIFGNLVTMAVTFYFSNKSTLDKP